MKQQDYLEVSQSADRETFERRLVGFAQQLDFDLVSAAVAVDRPGQRPLFDMVANTPAAYRAMSSDPGIINRDPIIKRLKTMNTPIVYDQAMYVAEDVADLWEMQAPHGYRTGIAMALHLPGGKHFLLGVDRPKALPASDAALTRLIADLQLLAIYAQDTALRVLLQQEETDTPVPRLTERERDVLLWTREGKSAWAVGQILAISEATVQTHLRNARQKLGVSSKHLAILRAMSLGII